ncbi:FMN-dependent NADH-azoreductase 1 [Bradyrhizobium sp. SSBR45G]|uniref:FMN-dependent NADH-azoreductase n=1 Tax=unclassified Bradyrhizobium TaxID=2631580 RepID=UPI002342B817|nr:MULTISPECIES: NAD(P)H-dependent oxidoreductase [unclassified Bradyrhizobium]GLH80006.1 FMN-dependent NADH-azoreductase 1 [Bradyrhizobium sp. SSBR45G]GLH87382.1 FMN-dependent NADH-azoreductase 1 [Bradyrhizobium sp. SSBR45R]
MPKLLHLVASPRADSESGAAARAFLDRFRLARPDWDIDELNVWREQLPEFDGEILQAKYARMGGRAFTDSQRAAFAVAERMAVRLDLAERVVISTPMWNFGIPYKLKHWLDIINQPGLTFRFDPISGYLPLLKDRPTLVILASGGDFTTGMSRGRSDLATPYLREALRFMGLRDLRFVPVGPTSGPAQHAAAARDRAHRQLVEMAARF